MEKTIAKLNQVIDELEELLDQRNKTAAEVSRLNAVVEADLRLVADLEHKLERLQNELVAWGIKIRDGEPSEIDEEKYNRRLDAANFAEIEEALKAAIENGSKMAENLELIETERNNLKRDLDFIQKQQEIVMAEQCPTDERHCTCVPILRQEIAKYQMMSRRMKSTLGIV